MSFFRLTTLSSILKVFERMVVELEKLAEREAAAADAKIAASRQLLQEHAEHKLAVEKANTIADNLRKLTAGAV